MHRLSPHYRFQVTSSLLESVRKIDPLFNFKIVLGLFFLLSNTVVLTVKGYL